jgi:spermidine synthase
VTHPAPPPAPAPAPAPEPSEAAQLTPGVSGIGAARIERAPTLILSLHLILVLSGLAGLGYQMVLARMLGSALGHEIAAVLAVVAAFFTGLALGAYALDGPIRRSRRPGHWYAALEAIIAVWALLLILLIPAFSGAVAALTGPAPSALRQWAIAFGGTLLLLLPATAAMGATLPAMERLVAGWRRDGRTIAGLYAANTAGAMAGTLLATFVLAPLLGFTATLVMLAAVNLACASAVLLGAARHEERRLVPAAGAGAGLAAGRLGFSLFLTGLLGIGYEVLVVRVLSQILEDTVYSFAWLLAVYLLGTAAGAALYQGFARKDGFESLFRWLLWTLASVCLLSIGLLWAAPAMHRAIIGLSQPGWPGAMTGEAAVAAAVFFLPTVVMGATFAHLAQAARDGLGLGRAIGLNTLGAALAPALFGVLMLPRLGSKGALVLVVLGYLALSMLQPARPVEDGNGRRAGVRPAIPGLIAATALLLALMPIQLRFVEVPEGGELLDYRTGVMASVAVVRDGAGVKHLVVNDRFVMGGTGTAFSDRRQAQIPLLLHPAPRNALFLGLGTGATFAASTDHPGLEATGVELVPEILPLLGHFGPPLEAFRADPHLRVLAGDARRFALADDRRYDVIVAEVFHPSRHGAGALYTVEHFQAVRERLRDGGLFCQWLPLFQLDLPTLRLILRSFLAVFPETQLHLAHFSLRQPILGLIAVREGAGHLPTWGPGWLARRIDDPRLARAVEVLRLDSDLALFGGFVAAAPALREFAGDGPLNTDDRPLLTYRAPHFVYGAPAVPAVRLLELVDALAAAPAELLGARDGASASGSDRRAFAARLAAYRAARDAFLHAGLGMERQDPAAMLRRIREPLLAVVRISGDFDPAYRPLLGMAAALHRTDPAAGGALLRDLEDAAPQREEARRLRAHLNGKQP